MAWLTPLPPCNGGFRPMSDAYLLARAAALKALAIDDLLGEAHSSLAWNGKFQAVGNSGWTGAINDRAMARALQEG